MTLHSAHPVVASNLAISCVVVGSCVVGLDVFDSVQFERAATSSRFSANPYPGWERIGTYPALIVKQGLWTASCRTPLRNRISKTKRLLLISPGVWA